MSQGFIPPAILACEYRKLTLKQNIFFSDSNYCEIPMRFFGQKKRKSIMQRIETSLLIVFEQEISFQSTSI
jgi:hypothetical protein